MPSTLVAINPAPLSAKSSRRLSNPPLSPTKSFSIAIPTTFGDLTPPSSPSEDEEPAAKGPKPSEFSSSPAPFKHYVGRSSFFSVNVNPAIAVEQPLPDSPTSSTADPSTPPLSPATRPTISSVEVPEEGVSISAISVPKFRHAPVQKPSFPVNLNGSRSRPPVRQSDGTPAPAPSSEDIAKLAALAEMYLPPSPALTPSHSSTVEEAGSLSDFDKPPTKHSRRCRLCKTWIQTRSGPGEGKLTHGVRMHMLKWHTAELGISKCRDQVGQRGVGEGWIL